MTVAFRPRAAAPDVAADPLFVVAERENPKRRFLFVSRVLGKHLPVDGRLCRVAGAALALRLAGDPRERIAMEALLQHDAYDGGLLLDDLARRPARMRGSVAVIGFAETATALGHAVADALDADAYLHTTRRLHSGEPTLTFTEDHSHAPDQGLHPCGLGRYDTVVLVDDELTTGRTAVNLVRSLQAYQPQSRYRLAALIDRLSPADHADVQTASRDLGCAMEVVSLRSSHDADLPDDDTPPAGRIPHVVHTARPHDVQELHYQPRAAPLTARTVMSAAHRRVLGLQADQLAMQLAGRDVVLGCGEFMALPSMVAQRLRAQTWSTTRSPVRVGRQPGYPITSGLYFDSPDAPGVPGFLYSSAAVAGRHVALLLETQGDLARSDELAAAIQSAAPASLTITTPIDS